MKLLITLGLLTGLVVQPSTTFAETNAPIETARAQHIPQAPEVYAQAMGVPEKFHEHMKTKHPKMSKDGFQNLLIRTYLHQGGTSQFTPQEIEEKLKKTAFQNSKGPYYREEIYQNVFKGLRIFTTNQGDNGHCRLEVEIYTDQTTSKKEAVQKANTLLAQWTKPVKKIVKIKKLPSAPESFEVKDHPLRKTTLVFDIVNVKNSSQTFQALLAIWKNLPGFQTTTESAIAKAESLEPVMARPTEKDSNEKLSPQSKNGYNLTSFLQNNIFSKKPLEGFSRHKLFSNRRKNQEGLEIHIANSSLSGYAALECTFHTSAKSSQNRVEKKIQNTLARIRKEAKTSGLGLADQQTQHNLEIGSTSFAATTTTLYVQLMETSEDMAKRLKTVTASLQRR